MPDIAATYPYRAKLGAMLRRARPRLEDLAVSVEQVCPAEEGIALPTVILKREAAKIAAVPPETTMATEMARIKGREVIHRATRRYVFEDVFVWPGGFSTKKGLVLNFKPPSAGALFRSAVPRRERGYFAACWASLRYYGHWVKDGLPALLLAEEGEEIVFPSDPGWWHAAPLLAMTGIERTALPFARYERLSFAEDAGQNSSKRARLKEIRKRVASGLPASPHERVYLKRGRGGAMRDLANEAALTAALEARGFAVLSSDEPAETLMPKLNGVKTLVSIEGSHSAAAFLGIAQGGVMLSISPADRFNAHHNDWGNSIGFTFAAAVAEARPEGHFADVDAVLETVDLAEGEAKRRAG